jgi:3D (Asp-Asp-Asp) domain-containing protein
MKAILVLFFAAEIVNATKVAVMQRRIDDLEGQRVIYAARSANWQDRAIQDEEVIDQLQTAADENALPDGLTKEYAGEFLCTAYCTEEYPHICGTGDGITASGQPIQADVTVAADQTLLPYGTVLYIEGVGVRVVQDKGAGVQGYHLDVAVDTHENALAWSGYGEHRVWIIKGE